jgi:hypothetical protein
VRLTLVAADGATREIEAVADTGNPCALIVDQDTLDRFILGLLPPRDRVDPQGPVDRHPRT